MPRILFFLIVGYILLLVTVYFFQRHLQYFPNRQYPGTPADNGLKGVEEVRLKTDDGADIFGWYMKPEKDGGRIVVFFHGNGGHIGHRAGKARYFIEKGYGIFWSEYRGYGGNKGRPTESGFYNDGRAVLRFIESEGYKPSQIALYGESIGSGVAVAMAREWQPQLLILEAPFSSAMAVAQRVYYYLPVSLLMKDRFDNVEKITDVKSSLLIVHGDEDTVIPLSLAQELYSAANHPKEFVTINGGGHNDLYEHHAGHIITEWLDKQP
jgi:fermentation-respiration switch protein FrsA (DUF1100 family)